MTNEMQSSLSKEFPHQSLFIQCDGASSDSIWKGPLSNGKALEFCTLITINDVIEKRISSINFPKFLVENPHLYYLRNEFPNHHDAQAGHDAVIGNAVSIADKFISAITPRATFAANNKNYMIYREGNPLHYIWWLMQEQRPYKERSDICIVDGEVDVRLFKNRLSIIHSIGDQWAEIEILIRNTNQLPINDFKCSSNYHVRTPLVIECSVSKTRHHVEQQIDSYLKLFGFKSIEPQFLFVHGASVKSRFDTIHVDMDDFPVSIISKGIKDQFYDAIRKAL